MSHQEKNLTKLLGAMLLGSILTMPAMAQEASEAGIGAQLDSNGDGVISAEEHRARLRRLNPDQREDIRDHREDIVDRREDVRDHREDVADRHEDRRDRREDRWDAVHNYPAGTAAARRDRVEDIRDQREDVRDRREDVRDRRENFRDRHENVRDRREDFVDRRDGRLERVGRFERNRANRNGNGEITGRSRPARVARNR